LCLGEVLRAEPYLDRTTGKSRNGGTTMKQHNRTHRGVYGFLLGIGVMSIAGVASAQPAGDTLERVPYLSGGIG
jgi:hypothetical protein